MQYTHIIYKLIFPNNKVYIGQTKQEFNRRLNFYKNIKKTYCNNYLYNAIKKYEWDNIKKEIICITSKEFINDLEKYYIKLYNSTNRLFGYNIEDGGEKDYNVKEETKEKIRKKLTGIKHTKKRKLKAGLRWKGNKNPKYNKNKKENHPMWNKHHSNETKKLMRKAKLGKKNPEHSKRMKGKNNPLWGKHHSNETIKLMKNIKLNKKYSKETIEKRIIKIIKSINSYTKTGIYIKTFESIKQASEELNINKGNIVSVLKNKRKSAGGYIFKYA